MGACAFCRIVLSVLLIALNAVGFVVGVVLMSLAAWQWTGYVGGEAFFDRIFGNSREVLLFFLSAGVAVAVLAVIGILAGVASLFARFRYLAAMLLLLYIAALFAIYTLQVITLSLDFSQYFASKGQASTNIYQSFKALLQGEDLGFNSSAAVFVEAVQATAMCCGFNNGSDYAGTETATYFWTKYPSVYMNAMVYRPRSCCGALSTNVSTVCNQWQPTYYARGCQTAFVAYYLGVTWSFLGLGVAAAVIEALVLILPLFLIGLVLSARCGRKAEKE